MIVSALLAVLAGVLVTGAVRAPVLGDPGPLVRWGLPAVRVLVDLGAVLCIGGLLFAATVLPVTPGAPSPARRRPALAHRPALLLATAGAALWTVAGSGQLVLSYADVSGTAPDSPGFGAQLGVFVRDLDLGRGQAFTLVLTACLTGMIAGALTTRAAALLTPVALVALVPASLAGHAASARGHETAVTALGLHLLGTTVWVGGLVVLVALWPSLHRTAPAVAVRAVRRYSTLAGWGWALVAGSGLLNAALRIGSWRGLASGYGALVLAKTVALALLGTAGAWHRRRVLPALSAQSETTGPASGNPSPRAVPEATVPARAVPASRAFLRLALAELVVMGVALGLAVALARSAPPLTAPVPTTDLALSRTGYPMPPAPSSTRWLTVWQPDLLWLVLAGLAALCYAGGIRRLRSGGHRWPLLRTVAWYLGLVVLVVTTSGPPVAYGRVLFSAHMLAHMTLTMVVPPLLVLGAPVSLALRALARRDDGTRGPREWLVAALHSRVVRTLGRAPVAAVVFAGSLVAFYFTPLFGLALRTHVGHELMQVHFLVAGYLFAWVLIGVDPGPPRPSHPLRLVVLLATMAFHAFFGVALISGTRVLASGWFTGLGRPWGASPLADQRTGGGLAWALGELPTLVLALGIAVQWARADERAAARRDRRVALRGDDTELLEYNAMLARLSAVDERRA